MGRFVSRNEWGARHARSTTLRQLSQIKVAHVHHADMPAPKDEAGEFAAVRSIQNFHMDDAKHKWADIGYHRVIGLVTGNVYEGRPIDFVGAETLGHNLESIGYCFLTDGQFTAASADAFLDQLAADELRTGNLTIRPHSADFATACPGDYLRGWISLGCPRMGVVVSTSNPPVSQPQGSPGGEVPAPSPTNNADNAKENEMMTPPILKEGDRGQFVANLQGLLWVHGLGGVLGDSPDHAMDGQFGSRTTTAVRQLQGKAGLPGDGVVGPLTWAALLDVK